MRSKIVLLGVLVSMTFAWSEALYSDTYMQKIKKLNAVVDTGISNTLRPSSLLNGKFDHIMRFEPLFFNGTEMTESSKKTLQSILDVINQRESSSYYVSVIGHTSDYTEPSHEIKLNGWSTFWHQLGGKESMSKEESTILANYRIGTVYNALIANNVNPSVIYNENRLGKDKIATEATKEGRAMNNRVDVSLYLKGNINLNINFELDSDIIVSSYNQKVQSFVNFLNNNPAYHAVIIGHTDKQGSYSYNMDLSYKRAQSTKKMLVSMGVDAKRLSAVAKGYTQPLDNSATQAAYRKNRRIEARLLNNR